MAAACALLGACDVATPPEATCGDPYPPQETSEYVLPWTVGESFAIGRGNCSSQIHTAGTAHQYAYDILMPVGTPVLAARGGTVVFVVEHYVDGSGIAGEENAINVLHEDGSIAGYGNLTRNGALVAVDDVVTAGQVIGMSGSSGSALEPQLHFHVQACNGCPTEPVTFRNTRPHPNGLQEGETYLAEDPEP